MQYAFYVCVFDNQIFIYPPTCLICSANVKKIHYAMICNMYAFVSEHSVYILCAKH